MSNDARRVSIGFEGGQVLAVRVTEKSLSALESALAAGGWHELRAEEAVIRVDLTRVVYVSAETDEQHVGFG